MPNPEIEKYVDTSLRTNMDAASIKRILVSAGWNPQEVDEAIVAQQGPHRATGPGMAETGPADAAGTMASSAAVVPKTGGSKKIFLIAGITVLLLLIAAGIFVILKFPYFLLLFSSKGQ